MKTVVFLPKRLFTKEELALIGPAEFYGEKVESESDLIGKCRGAEAVLAAMSRTGKLTERFFESLPELKFVSVYATGYDWVDVDAARKNGVVVSNCPGYSTPAVADWTISMIQRLGVARGKALGVIGLGRIGQEVAKRAKRLGMEVIAWDRKPKAEFQVPLEELLKKSDFVTLHLALNEETRHFIGKKEIALMKRGAFLINSAREGLVDINALREALESGKLGGAAIDLDIHSKMDVPGAIATPHRAWKSEESARLGNKMFVGNLVAWRRRKPQNVIS